MLAVKRKFYLSLIATIAMLVHIIRSILLGFLSLPGHDVSLAEEPERFWLTISFLSVIAVVVLVRTSNALKKIKAES
jgi:hypothetical protein